jgi:hypothetical protein
MKMTRADVASTAYVSHLNMRIRVFVARLTYGLGGCVLAKTSRLMPTYLIWNENQSKP